MIYVNETREGVLNWDKRVGLEVRIRRQDKGWSQSKLAKASGLNLDTISKTELGKSGPQSHTLFRIADALNCKIDDFYSAIRRKRTVRF